MVPRAFLLLPWDSSLFGFPVARLSADAIENGRLPEAVNRMRSEGIRLAYASVPWSDTNLARALAAAGGRCVDRKVWYRKVVTPDRPMPSGVGSARGTPCTPDLERLALASGEYSRFRVDPNIPAAIFETLYRAWIRRSLTGEIAGDVPVIRDGGPVVGMATVARSDAGATGVIGLIAVDEGHRGKGHGTRLVQAAEAWCAAEALTAVEVVTQMQNTAACGLYAACGYETVRDEAFFHVWLEPVQ